MDQREARLFDRRLAFPDLDARRRFDSLVGLDQAKTRLAKLLGFLVNPDGVQRWANRFHNASGYLVDLVQRRPPLVLLAGDVGTGKTEIAETVGDAVARQESIDVTALPLSLATRGSGRVGEMTRLISAAFEETVMLTERLKSTSGKSSGAIILIVDEADSIAQSREADHMHHEDRAGVNAFIRGVDRLATLGLPAATLLCTNRLGAIDPAVRRRAAEIIEFARPNDQQRDLVLRAPLLEVGFSDDEVKELVKLTGRRDGCGYGFTYSDLTQRLLPSLVLDAYPNGPIVFDRAVELVRGLSPTPPFRIGNGE